jgi:hypothetical protein
MNSSFVESDEPLIQVESKRKTVELDLDGPHVGDEGGAPGIPNRLSMLNLSWVFLFAAITLTAGFVMVNVSAPPSREFVNGTFLVSCVAWLYGFSLLVQWTWALPGARDWASLSAAACKWIASVLFCLQPATALWQSGWGFDWSNLVGICFFHLGNCISVLAMRKLFAYGQPLSFGNLPVFGMWCYFAATTQLVIANTLFYAQIGVGTSWFAALQIGGGCWLVFGSVLYILWAGCFRCV